MSDAGPEVMASLLAYPQDAAARRTRIYYGLIFLCSKTLSLALTFLPASGDVVELLFGLSVTNFLFSFLLDACARRESKRWAGENGDETNFSHCLLETVLGSWMTHKLIDKCSDLKQSTLLRALILDRALANELVSNSGIFSAKQQGSIRLPEASEDTEIETAVVVTPKGETDRPSMSTCAYIVQV